MGAQQQQSLQKMASKALADLFPLQAPADFGVKNADEHHCNELGAVMVMQKVLSRLAQPKVGRLNSMQC